MMKYLLHILFWIIYVLQNKWVRTKKVTLLEQNKIRSADVSVNVSIYDGGELSYNDKQNISLPCNDQNM